MLWTALRRLRGVSSEINLITIILMVTSQVARLQPRLPVQQGAVNSELQPRLPVQQGAVNSELQPRLPVQQGAVNSEIQPRLPVLQGAVNSEFSLWYYCNILMRASAVVAVAALHVLFIHALRSRGPPPCITTRELTLKRTPSLYKN